MQNIGGMVKLVLFFLHLTRHERICKGNVRKFLCKTTAYFTTPVKIPIAP